MKKVGKNYVELSWTPPANDGGSKITNYVVEKRPVGSNQWTKASPYTVVDNTATVTDLPENGEFEFRVKAVNKAGEGEPSSTTGRVKITEYPSKKRLWRLDLIELLESRWPCTNICEETCRHQCAAQR